MIMDNNITIQPKKIQLRKNYNLTKGKNKYKVQYNLNKPKWMNSGFDHEKLR